MEYTKDIVLQVNYGQDVKRQRRNINFFDKICVSIKKHKIMLTVLCMTVFLTFLDIMMVVSFTEVLSNL